MVLSMLDFDEESIESKEEEEESISSGNYMDDDFFDHFTSEDDFGCPK